MRIAVTALLVISLLVSAHAQEDGPKTYSLKSDYQSGFEYVTSRTETVSSAIRFETTDKDGNLVVQSGSAVDTHELEVRRETTAFDDEGALKTLRIHYSDHELTQQRQNPGESVIKQTYSGDGPLRGAIIDETWDGEKWKRSLQRNPRTEFGFSPDELKKLLEEGSNVRAHPLLPEEPVAVGDDWKPDTGELNRLLKRFGHENENEPKLEASCKLVSVTDGKAKIEVTASLKGLTPLNTGFNTAWDEDATVDVKLDAELLVDLENRFIESEAATIVAESEGRIKKNKQWFDATATVTIKTSSVTKKLAKPADDED